MTLVADAHTTQDTTEWGNIAPADIITFTNLYWTHTAAPGRSTAVVPTAEVAFAAAS